MRNIRAAGCRSRARRCRASAACRAPSRCARRCAISRRFAIRRCRGDPMQDTAHAGAASQAAPPTRRDALARVHRRRRRASAGRKTLPLTDVPPVYEAVLGQLQRAVGAADFSPRERATHRRSDARARSRHLHTELARRYAGKPQPAAERELEAADQAHRAVAGAVGAVLGVPEAAARRRPRAAGRQGQDPAARPVRRQAAACSCTASRGACRRRRSGRSCTPTTAWPRCSTARSPRCPTTCMPHAVGISCYSTYMPRAAARARRSVRDVGAPDRAHRPLARRSGRARSFPYAQQRETEGPVIADRPRRRRRRDAGSPARRAMPPPSMRYRLSRQARDQRARAPEAACRPAPIRRSCSSATTCRVEQCVSAAVASRRALVPAAARRRRTSPTRARAVRRRPAAPRISASAAARSTARIRSAGCRSRARSTCRRSAR